MFPRFIGRFFLWIFGWRLHEPVPRVDKAVMIAAPHTTNWDAIFMLAVASAAGLRISWLVKKEAYRWPWSIIMKRTGAILVDRSQNTNMVDRLASIFAERDQLVLAIPASGTRKKRDYWKSGFYHVASAAKVPIALGFLDYARKTGGVGGLVMPTGDIRADMDKIRAFYGGVTGKHPELTTRIRLRVEDELDASPAPDDAQAAAVESAPEGAPSGSG